MLGKPVPDFSLPATGKRSPFRLSLLRGRRVVLYFYPKDHTPGCSVEGADFAASYPAFRRANCEVLGLSRDPLTSHERFKQKMQFPFELLSDPDAAVCEQFGVMKLKKMYGKQVRGIERSTFLIDEQGLLLREWRGVKVTSHVQEVLNFAQAL